MKNKGNFFWPSFSDLMTSLFFVMLALFVLSYILYSNEVIKYEKEAEERQQKIEKLERNVKLIQSVTKNLNSLKNNSDLFIFDPIYKRFNLAFQVKFKTSKTQIRTDNIDVEPNLTIENINRVGATLFKLISDLKDKKDTDSTLKNISYLMVITGSASDLPDDNIDEEYFRSYERAFNLFKYWKLKEFDFDKKEFHEILDVQISGIGLGGVGRFKRDSENFYQNESLNQRFLITLIPKYDVTDFWDVNNFVEEINTIDSSTSQVSDYRIALITLKDNDRKSYLADKLDVKIDIIERDSLNIGYSYYLKLRCSLNQALEYEKLAKEKIDQTANCVNCRIE